MATQITPFTKTPSRQNPSTFSADMDARLAEENSRIVQMNTQSNENNTLAQIVKQNALQVSIDKTATTTAKNEAISAKDEAVLAKNEIKSYVIPTEATYSPITIEAKLDMAETLNLVGA